MKAIRNEKYGLPNVLQLKEVERPVPKNNEVLVKVHASSINSWDWDYLTGRPRLYRLFFGLFKPKHKILGADIAGQVLSVGGEVKLFKPGDMVYGDLSAYNWGGFAEFVCADENLLSTKPANLTYEEAAAVPQAGVLALQGLRHNGDIEEGHKVLINGAGGGVGTFALQLAKLWGAEVTAVDRSDKLDVLLDLGADFVIDYQKENFTKTEKKYDLILDVIAKKPLSKYKSVLNPNGAFVVVGGSVTLLLKLALKSIFPKKSDRKMGILMHKPNRQDLKILQELLESGKLKPIVDQSFPLAKTRDAFTYYGKNLVKGKIVITVE
ncbi:NAD(P)-dependent alcohol dehydrogenase [Ulvibacterium marinum]|uniref:NAD(P)-dependent alcohol dehydrogenase n=1 Tax=Ulvibacterium marinum TaxID=2419782 RepID=A0A3B0C816_9FLAO|nr:NAD(P)-dependent alcohol dehydrogenase [Ulvibacterium marinum]RKN81610.1 NAD(P)-dependent alcohol dehydrogenase [Ulvibacterium marinum]